MTRRRLLTTGLAATAGAAGIAALARAGARSGLLPPDHCGAYGAGETLSYAANRLLGAAAVAREFPRGMISSTPFANEVAPLGPVFAQHQAASFRDWRLVIDGRVARPLALSIADLRQLPIRRQITEVACEEGWSYIAEWIGTPLAAVLREAGVLPGARYLVYFSIQPDQWESVDIDEALHPQTLVTYAMNDGDLPVGFGGPLRLRVPRQLGYKSIKFITRLTVADSMKHFGKGLGSASPETGYAWWAGI